MSYMVIYGVISDKHRLKIDGPYFHCSSDDKESAENDARELANSKTKDVIIPWVIEFDGNIPNAMEKAANTWFSRFRNRTLENAKMLNRYQEKALCPFRDVDITDLARSYIKI